MRHPLRAAIVLCLLTAIAHADTWTDQRGRQVEGEFVRLDVTEDRVYLKLAKNGKVAGVPLSKLTDEDQTRARELWEAALQPCTITIPIVCRFPMGVTDEYGMRLNQVELFYYDPDARKIGTRIFTKQVSTSDVDQDDREAVCDLEVHNQTIDPSQTLLIRVTYRSRRDYRAPWRTHTDEKTIATNTTIKDGALALPRQTFLLAK